MATIGAGYINEIHNGLCVEEFDLTTNDFSQLSILENGAKTACNVKSKDGRILYKSFILDRNSRTIIKCDITFYRSSVDNRYIPRLIFRKCNLDASEQESTKQSVRIAFDNSNLAKRFWGLINFLSAFKDLVDTGSFEKEFKVVTEDYAGLLNSLDSKEKITAIKRLLRSTRFSQDEINSLVYESRRQVVRRFLWLLRNKKLTNGESSREYYKRIKCLSGGDETIWHHFLRENDWILGLNADIRFISHFVDEAKVGIEDSRGKGSPKVDMIGVSYYTTLVELKTPDTLIFKLAKGARSRANTWEFSSDFIAGVSQCLGQKVALDETYSSKIMCDKDGGIISKDIVYNKDVKVIFVIGNRSEQFPHNSIMDNVGKSQTFELFRRNNRNVEIITYDELFERAYHMVFMEKLPDGWYANDSFDIKK